MNSNYFETVSSVTFLDSQTGLVSGMFLFKTVILYHYTLYNIIAECISVRQIIVFYVGFLHM